MKVTYSTYLSSMEAPLRQLTDLLNKQYEYASILATDVSGTEIRVAQRQKAVRDYWLNERGFVARVYRDGQYSEYSFNELDPDKVEEQAEKIVAELNKQLAVTAGLSKYKTAMLQEEDAKLFVEKEVKVLPETVSVEEIVNRLTKISNAALQQDAHVFEFISRVMMIHVNKLFLSAKKNLKQSYLYGEGMLGALVRDGEVTKMDYKGYSGLKGAEILDELEQDMPLVVKNAVELLSAERVVPGEYEVICPPEVTGLIAHEAFGHGVEMDMFVKNRSLGASYLQKQVASLLSEMHDGAECFENTSSYAFDDEGTLAGDTTIIKGGILQTGICDALSALRLKTTPTGNGKRESYERKAYTRMTNTFFCAGKDGYEDMIKSIRYGYLLEGVQSGMEDPKNWGIQCMLTKGREIVDGKLTGKVVSPIIMTGYVPDLLKSISMVGPTVEISGTGYCGKGHKEYVKAADGGPYLKAKARLG